MTTDAGENVPPPAKRRKWTQKAQKGEDAEAFYPFRLVPSPQEARRMETRDVWVTSSIATAGVSELLKFVRDRFPTLDMEKGMNLTHLKRLRKNGDKTDDGMDIIEIMLCAASTASKEQMGDIIGESSKMASLYNQTARGVQDAVARCATEGHHQDDQESAKEAAEMTRVMRKAITTSNQHHQSHPQDLPITALLVNLKTSEVLLTAHDTRLSTHHPLNHAVMLLLKQPPSLLYQTMFAPDDPHEEEQYYAQMYGVYMTHEPCTMCCMALVHGRIRRSVFCKGTKTGATEVAWMKGMKWREF